MNGAGGASLKILMEDVNSKQRSPIS